MKIADIRAYPLETRTALVRVVTDDGVEGVGERGSVSRSMNRRAVIT